MKKLKRLTGNKMRGCIPALICALCIGIFQGNSFADTADVNAANLVRRVRESENWIHKVDSFYVRFESRWTKIEQAKSNDSMQMSERVAASIPEQNQQTITKAGPAGILEYAFDNKHTRYLNADSNNQQLKIWDGNQLIICQKGLKKEQYSLADTLQGSFPEFIAAETSWPKAQPHSFWFDTRDVGELLCYYGKPGEFVLTGNQNYRGSDCFVLEFRPRDVKGPIESDSEECPPGEKTDDKDKFGVIGQVKGLADQTYRWYVGRQDGLLHGVVWLIDNRCHTEHWMNDYRQVSAGCWFPMTQGVEICPVDNFLKPADKSRRDLKVLEVKVNEKLPDDLFRIELREGVEVADNRFGRTATYKYKAAPPELTGKLLPPFDGIDIKISEDQLKNKPIVVCFIDIDQRPSRYLVQQLAGKARQLREKGVEIIAIHPSRLEKGALSESIKKLNLPFPIGIIKGDDEKIETSFGVRSLPCLILADAGHTVKAQGFSINELDTQIDGMQK
jgi:hypothetical protein